MEERKNKTSNVIEINKATTRDEISASTVSKFGPFKPNEELLQSTARIKQQRDVIRDRILKMEGSSGRVSHNVFQKVRRDYELQLQTISDLLDEKKEELKKEIKDLYVRREKLTVEINRHREILEEAEFRNYLGEYSQAQFQEVENYETKEIEKLETDLTHIGKIIRSHEELFDPEDLGQKPSGADEMSARMELPAKSQIAPAKQLPQGPQQRREVPPLKKPLSLDEEADGSETTPVGKREELLGRTPAKPVSKDPEGVDFESLFDDADEDEHNQASDLQQQENIRSILQSSQKEFDRDSQQTQLESDPDYFRDESVEEDSFTLSKKLVKPTSEKALQDQEQRATDPHIPQDASTSASITLNKRTDPAVLKEESLSDILDSIGVLEEPSQKGKDISSQSDRPLMPTKPQKTAGAQFVLTLVSGEHDWNQFPLKENISIGRSPSNDIVFKAPKVSRQHAAINRYNNQYIIIDLKSSNGVYVNGAKVDECVLNPGDEISIGGYRMVFERKDH